MNREITKDELLLYFSNRLKHTENSKRIFRRLDDASACFSCGICDECDEILNVIEFDCYEKYGSFSGIQVSSTKESGYLIYTGNKIYEFELNKEEFDNLNDIVNKKYNELIKKEKMPMKWVFV